MKTWQEACRIFGRIRELEGSGGRAALAVIVHIKGSTYRRAGARLLIEEDGTMIGNVSGGCLEQDVRKVAERVMASGRPETIHYETGSDEDVLWGMGMGCDGEMDIFLQPCPPEADPDMAGALCARLAGDDAFALSCVVDDSASAGRMFLVRGGRAEAGSTGDADRDAEVLSRSLKQLESGEADLYTVGSARIFTDVLRPPPHLVVCGAGDDAIPLVAYAADMGLRVTVVDHRPAYLAADRFPQAFAIVEARAEDENAAIPSGPDTYVVVKTRALAHDEAWAKRFLRTDVPYIGLLGPRARREKILDEMSTADQVRVYGPVGLDVGADGPEQIALSIVAEVLAVASAREPGHLRAREKPIH